jgi:hypothetical protein
MLTIGDGEEEVVEDGWVEEVVEEVVEDGWVEEVVDIWEEEVVEEVVGDVTAAETFFVCIKISATNIITNNTMTISNIVRLSIII